MADYDYVIVGAGSAGCVLANRLSEDPAVTVALLEAGPSDAHPYVHMPRGIGKLLAMPAYMWFYLTQPEARTANRPDRWLRGKVLGGSSSVNGMVWVKGQPADFDHLASLTSDDWGWEHIARAYEAIEAHELGPAPSRGGSGPLGVSLPPHRNALTEAIAQAGARMGWPIKADVNEPDDGQGIGYMPRSIRKGRRQSAAVAFLRPIKGRKNLTILTGALTDRVTFDGKRATGVEILHNGVPRTIGVQREVILCAGAVASPGVLERSGIGDPAVLAPLGIPVVHANRAVGENASEHRGFMMQWRLKQPLSYNREYAGPRLLWNVLRYYLNGSGPMTVAAMDMRAAFRSRPQLNRADIQTQIGLFSWDLTSAKRSATGLEAEHGFCTVTYPMVPASLGAIHIETRDPAAMPRIVANYGAVEDDRSATIAAVRQLRQWAAQAPLAGFIEAESLPGPQVQSDEDLLAMLDTYGVCGIHTVGSCRMGKDPASVVDPELRVRGVDGLRVMDTSVFPVIPAGNTNAPTIAMAWRAAEVIRRG